MEAGAKSLRFLGEGKKLQVPFFQRRYVWEKSNWQELLDTFQNTDTTPFLGSIILKEESAKKSYIIDGQQRLTTITILAKAIYDCLSSESKQPDSGIRNSVQNYLFYRNNAADDFPNSFVRIEHSRIDQDDYNKVIESQMLHNVPAIELNQINPSSGNVLRCYKYYCEKLQNMGDSSLKNLFNAIFEESRRVFVLIELDRDDINEQTIFDTINRAGVHLSAADIIKNNIFKRILDVAGNDDDLKSAVLSLYDNCWERVFNIDSISSEMWDEERVFGNVKHTNLEFLLYCVACIKWGEDRDMFSNLENVFTNEINLMDWNQLVSLVNDIKEYANIFRKYVLEFKTEFEDEDNEIHFKYCDGVKRLQLILQKFGVQMFYPYVIKRIKDVNCDNENPELLKDFRILESFIIRRKISPKGTHDYTSKCYLIIKYGISKLIETDLGNDSAGITDDDVKRYLFSTKDDTAKMILFWIELYRRRLSQYDINSLEYKYTLEHIMPQKWETNWLSVPIKENGNLLDGSTEEGKAIRNSYVQSIGNKTLLKFSLNSSLKNTEYGKKITGLGGNKTGYKSHTSLLLTKELVDNFDLDPVWDESHIIKRTTKLYCDFLEIWPSFKELLSVSPVSASSTESSECIDDLSDADLTKYSSEELADPIKLAGAVNNKDIARNTYLTANDFIRIVNVQEETIDKYIKDGKIIPDFTIGNGNKKSQLYFRIETIYQYANRFNWTIITDENRKFVFLKMIEQMTMSYSYKPVFIKSLFDCIDSNGKCDLSAIVYAFWHFYHNRISDGLIPERKDSVMVKKDCSLDEAENLLLTYPLKRFTDMGVIDFSKDDKIVSLNMAIWSKMSKSEINSIIHICDVKIAEYYSKNLISNESN